MLTKTLLGVAALAIVVFAPAASAACTQGAVSYCIGDISAPTSSGGTFRASWAFPSTVDTDSQSFIVSVSIDTTAAGQTLVLPAASAWNYQGCSSVSETTASVAGVVRNTNAKIQMTSPYCLVWFAVSTTGAGSVTTSTLPISMQVQSRSIPDRVAGTVTLAGGVALSGTLDQQTRLCAASATGSPCTTPTVLACSSPALDADPQACSSGITNVNNTVGAVTIPSTFHLCGPETVPGDCTPVQSGGTMTVAGLFSDPFLRAMLWLMALVFFLRLGKVLAAGACTMGFAMSCIHGASATASEGGQLVSLMILGIALWLEAVAREKIYTRWFQPAETPGAVKPQ